MPVSIDESEKMVWREKEISKNKTPQRDYLRGLMNTRRIDGMAYAGARVL